MNTLYNTGRIISISRLIQLNSRWKGYHIFIRKVSSNSDPLHSTATITNSNDPETKAKVEPRHFSQIPGFKRYPILGSFPSMFLHKDYNTKNFLKFLMGACKTYGPIVRMDSMLGGGPLVLLSDPDDIEAVFRSTNQNPVKRGLTSLKYVRYHAKNHNFEKQAGILTENGAKWWRVRSKVQTPMLRPKNVVTYLPQVDQVTKDFIKRIIYFQKKFGQMPSNFIDEMYKWSFESVCLVAFSRRMGCLEPNLTPDSFQLTLMKSIDQLFTDVNETEVKIKWWKLLPSPSLKRLQNNHEKFLLLADKAISETENNLKQNLRHSKDELTLLETLLHTPGLSRKDVLAMVLDMLVAGVDTTSHTLAFALYLLAKNPSVQHRLQKEVDEVLGEDVESPLTESHMKKFSYLKACVKESSRMFPIIPGILRVLQEDLVLSGYKVPKGWTAHLCHVVTCKDERLFPRVKEFLPERWHRDQPLGPIHPFASVPFSYGTRMCIGRRIAEQEIYVALARIMQQFNMDYQYEDVDVVTRFISTPSEPLKFKFSPRKNKEA